MTIGGQSAGAASCHFLTLSPLGKGLFKRAIIQSGTASLPWAITDMTRERAFMLGKALNFETNNTENLMRKLVIKILVFKIYER